MVSGTLIDLLIDEHSTAVWLVTHLLITFSKFFVSLTLLCHIICHTTERHDLISLALCWMLLTLSAVRAGCT